MLSRLISGKGYLKLEQEIFQRVLEWEFASGSSVWYARVPSHANVADAPSRCVVTEFDVKSRVNVDPGVFVNDIVSHLETYD